MSESTGIYTLCALSAAQTGLFLLAVFIHWARFLTLLWSPGIYSWSAEHSMAWNNSWNDNYTAPDHEDMARKSSHCVLKKLSFDFSISKSGIISSNMPGRDYGTPSLSFPVLYMLLSSLRMECIHNNLHMSHFCLCGLHWAINWR